MRNDVTYDPGYARSEFAHDDPTTQYAEDMLGAVLTHRCPTHGELYVRVTGYTLTPGGPQGRDLWLKAQTRTGQSHVFMADASNAPKPPQGIMPASTSMADPWPRGGGWDLSACRQEPGVGTVVIDRVAGLLDDLDEHQVQGLRLVVDHAFREDELVEVIDANLENRARTHIDG